MNWSSRDPARTAPMDVPQLRPLLCRRGTNRMSPLLSARHRLPRRHASRRHSSPPPVRAVGRPSQRQSTRAEASIQRPRQPRRHARDVRPACRRVGRLSGWRQRRTSQRCTWRADRGCPAHGRNASWSSDPSAMQLLWTSRSGTPASSAAVMKLCRRLCGEIRLSIPAAFANRVTRVLVRCYRARS